MSKLDIAKKIIKEHYHEAECGVFNCENTADDEMDVLYEDDELTILICRYYSYYEVFGLSNAEFEALARYYNYLEDGIVTIDETPYTERR